MGKLNLRDFFFEKEEEKKEEKPVEKASIVQKSKDTPKSGDGQGSAQVDSAPIASGDGQVREEVLDKLEETLRQENIPGPDYFELKETAESKEAIENEPDRKKRWRQVFMSMKLLFPGSNVTVEKLESSVDQYINVMETAKKDGNAEVKRKLSEQVEAPREKIALEEQELSRQEEALLKRRAELEEKKAAIDKREAELIAKSKDFDVSVDFVINGLKDDKKKMVEYLKD